MLWMSNAFEFECDRTKPVRAAGNEDVFMAGMDTVNHRPQVGPRPSANPLRRIPTILGFKNLAHFKSSADRRSSIRMLSIQVASKLLLHYRNAAPIGLLHALQPARFTK